MKFKLVLLNVIVGLFLCAGLVGCGNGGATTSNADIADAAKSIGDKAKDTPDGPPLHSFGNKPGSAKKPGSGN